MAQRGGRATRPLLAPPADRAGSARGSGADDSSAPDRAHREGNFVTYVQTQLDTLDSRPLCAVDSLVLSWISYFRLLEDGPLYAGFCSWEGLSVRELLRAEDFPAMFGDSWDPEGSRELLMAVCASPRFRDMRVAGYRTCFSEVAEEQFAAMTFLLPDGGVYVAFRGTDSTLVGWKEDFNMAFQSPVPAQVSAAAYLEEAALACPGPLYVGGHSKGGNLAVYAAIMCPHRLQDRIVRAFSHDGPGFNEKLLRGAGFARMRERIDKTLPRSSIFGMIFEDQEDYAIVDSTSFSLMQHNPFSWVVEGDDFRRVERISAGARYLDSTLAAWMARISPEERGRVIDAAFSIFGATDATYFAEIRDNWQESLPKMLAAASEVTPETRDLIKRTVAALVRVATVGKVSDSARRAAGRAADAAGQLAESARSAGEAAVSAARAAGDAREDAASEHATLGEPVDVDALDELAHLLDHTEGGA